MTARLVLILGATFVVTLVLVAWHDGVWERSVRPLPAAAPESLPVPPQLASPVPATLSVPALADHDAAVAPDSTAPPASERERSEGQREGARGARTR
jgi:hypothetical protein